VIRDRNNDTIDFPPRRSNPRRIRLLLVVVLVLLLLGGGTALSYYVEALWFGSLGYAQVFWSILEWKSAIFAVAGLVTFVALFGAFLALKPASFGEIGNDGVIIINDRPVKLPVGPVLSFVAMIVAALVALGTAAGMMSEWPTIALWWHRGDAVAAGAQSADPIFGRPIAFYLFTLPAWQLAAGWLLRLALLTLGLGLLFFLASNGTRALQGRRAFREDAATTRGLAIAWALVLVAIALEVYLARFEYLFQDHSIFAGVTYTEAYVTLTGRLLTSLALAAGGLAVAVAAFVAPRIRWLVVATVPALAIFVVTGAIAAYVESFVVKPNELVREQPYIAHNIAFTRQAYGLNRFAQRPFPAETTVEAADAANNQATLQNIRLWDWRVLQDTLRQLQEIRTYYDFPDIDIDRYDIDGTQRQVMLATRELNITKLAENSRTWINEKLIYTHGYGLTMNAVNGFTPEGLPLLILRDMPVQSSSPGVKVTRPEIYFGELTDTDVYVRTRQQEFNYPQGEVNSLTSYEGSGGIVLNGRLRRLLIALDRGDIAKLPFSDDVTDETRLLMRRNVRERVTALAPFLHFDPDPYIVLGPDGRLSWMMDAFTISDRYPFSRAYRAEGVRVNYLRNSVKAVIDAYDGTTTFYVFDAEDPIISTYRKMFPTLFKDAAAMPAGLRAHVRYPEMLLALQAEVYGLYHMTNPQVFYNREDLWTVAMDVVAGDRPDKTTQPMEPNFLLMKLPGETSVEFVEMLPFTPANRNNLIGWIAGRSDGDHYGDVVVYDFPKTRLVDGPLQVEARIDQNAQLSGQLSLWNQQGSRVRRGPLLVIPIGHALLYAQAIYLQADRSPMPELRLVVLALQDRLVYAPTFEAALTSLFGAAGSQGAPPSGQAAGAESTAPATPAAPDVQQLIAEAAKSLADYQRLTAEGKLGEAGQKLEQLKRTLDELSKRR
jgi:uncharacterized membrane protein (UPF0182 family)